MSAKEDCRLLPKELLEEVVPMIRAAAHPLRIRILDYLDQEGEPRTVSLITEVCAASQAVVSQQLRILKDQGILSCQRQGNCVLYSIADSSILHLVDCIRSRHTACGGAAGDASRTGAKPS